MKGLTIGQLSKQVGLPAKTIRFYEESGVIPQPPRGENGYRLYPHKSVEELKLLKYARDLGIPLIEIKKLMKGCSGNDCAHSGEYIRSSIDNYLSLLSEKITRLLTLQTKLQELRNGIHTSDSNTGPYCCNLLHQLVESSQERG